jgi:glycosyltransferase involved in cell wall biosynthesis
MKISVLMPTYNDSKYITQTFDSLLRQTYKEWELIIIDDGSTDNTREIIKNYIEKNDCKEKFQYHYEKNADQLNALQNAIHYITGDYVYILHSDDLLYSDTTFSEFVEFERNNSIYDMYMGDITIINGDSQVTGSQKVLELKSKKSELALMYLWLGRNILVDFAYFNAQVFKEKVKENYLTWNMPAWVDNSNNYMLNVKKLPFNMFKYRLDGNNYIDNEIGKQNVLNGELRTAIYLMNSFSIPMYPIQYFIYRVLNKFNLKKYFEPIYFNRSEKNKAKVIDFIIRKRFKNGYEHNKYFNSIYHFYKNENDRAIEIPEIGDYITIYRGCDMRAFNKALNTNELDEFYNWFMEEMHKGFTVVKCKTSDRLKVEDILKFFDIDKVVKILEVNNM